MNVDIVGRVNNLVLPRSKGLLPVQEAVINSIEACIDIPDAKVELIIDRDTSQSELDDQRPVYPISGFRIIDNGIGFNEENYSAFVTSDTTLKADSGGKGIGRFLWLKAFESAHVDSIYRESDKMYRRIFDFRLTRSAVENYSLEQTVLSNLRTEVILYGLRSKYQLYVPKRTSVIAQNILEHCLSFFLLGKGPTIIVLDRFNDEKISLNELFQQNVQNNIESRDINIHRNAFHVDIIRYPTTSESTHRVFYCAHSREVRTENLQDTIPLLYKRIQDSETEFVFMVYVSSQYLDATVNQERTGFTYDPDEDGQPDLEFEDVIPFREIREAVSMELRTFADQYLEPIRKEHRDRVAYFVREKSPEYRHILKHRLEEIDEIPLGTSDDKLELSLHQISQRMEREVKETSLELLKTDSEKIANVSEFKKKYNQLVDKITDIGQDNLARYIVHRRMILSLLENRLKIQDNNRYSLEESIHEIVIPLRTTSDDTDYLKQNLWIIDEKLSYHFFLASEQPLSKIPYIASDSKDRPDIVIFNKPLAFAEDEPPYSSIVVVEFKRPVRDDYTDDDNPITQVMRYITEIRDKKVKDNNGRFINIEDNTPFYAYIICDITPRLRDIVKLHGFYRTPDIGGYYWFNQNIKSYIEIISFDKLLSDAKKRNRVLFERLGLNTSM